MAIWATFALADCAANTILPVPNPPPVILADAAQASLLPQKIVEGAPVTYGFFIGCSRLDPPRQPIAVQEAWVASKIDGSFPQLFACPPDTIPDKPPILSYRGRDIVVSHVVF